MPLCLAGLFLDMTDTPSKRPEPGRFAARLAAAAATAAATVPMPASPGAASDPGAGQIPEVVLAAISAAEARGVTQTAARSPGNTAPELEKLLGEMDGLLRSMQAGAQPSPGSQHSDDAHAHTFPPRPAPLRSARSDWALPAGRRAAWRPKPASEGALLLRPGAEALSRGRQMRTVRPGRTGR